MTVWVRKETKTKSGEREREIEEDLKRGREGMEN